ncbi:hypothetical protein SUGI_0075260 [Cryptomeria japonica]|nr:hypothetical protein SUGI_0075260 [Cryptomeria japonica]
MAQKRCRDPDDNTQMQNKQICIKQSEFDSLSSSENIDAEKEFSNGVSCNLFDADIKEQTLGFHEEDCVSELMRHLKEEIDMCNEADNSGQSSVESNDVHSKLWEMGFQSTTHETEDTCNGNGMNSFVEQTEFTDFILMKEIEFMGNNFNEIDNEMAAVFRVEDCSYTLDMVSDKFYSDFMTGDELWQFDDEVKWSDIQREGADLEQKLGESEIPNLGIGIKIEHPQA